LVDPATYGCVYYGHCKKSGGKSGELLVDSIANKIVRNLDKELADIYVHHAFQRDFSYPSMSKMYYSGIDPRGPKFDPDDRSRVIYERPFFVFYGVQLLGHCPKWDFDAIGRLLWEHLENRADVLAKQGPLYGPMF
jgi:hypothetical protein